MNLKGNYASDKYEVRNMTVRKLSVMGNFTYTPTGISNAVMPNLKNVNLKITLHRNGHEIDICNTNLLLLLIVSQYRAGIEQLFGFVYLGNPAENIYTMNCELELDGPINVHYGDRLEVELTLNNGWIDDTNFNTNQTGIEVLWEETSGVEHFTPIISAKVIPATWDEFTYSTNNHINCLSVINLNIPQPSNTYAASIVNQFDLVSHGPRINYTWDKLMKHKQTMFQSKALAELRGQNFQFRFHEPITEVNLTLRLNGANVLATQNYIVTHHYRIDKHTLDRAQNHKEQLHNASVKRIGGQLSGGLAAAHAGSGSALSHHV